MHRGRQAIIATTLCGLPALWAVAGSGSLASAASCTAERYSWDGSPRLYYADHDYYATGIYIPPPVDGETLTITSAVGQASDTYPDGASPNRADVDQANERYRFSVGGVNFGPLSADLPDTLAEGAVTEWYSGLQTTNFGSGPTPGGYVVVLQAANFGFTESPNSLNVHSLVIDVERCVPDPTTTVDETTTTTVDEPTTTVEQPTTTVSGSTTTTPAPSTSVESRGPVPPSTNASTTTTSPTTGPTVAQAGPVPPRSLPATGRSWTGTLGLGTIVLALGGALVGITRRRTVD